MEKKRHICFKICHCLREVKMEDLKQICADVRADVVTTIGTLGVGHIIHCGFAGGALRKTHEH